MAVPKAVASVRAPSIDTVVSGPNQGSAGSTVRPQSGEGMPKVSSPVSASSVAGRSENLTVGAEATASPGATGKAAELPGSTRHQGHRRTDSGFGGDIFDGKESGPAQGGDVGAPLGELPPESGHAPDGSASESSVASGLDAGLRARLEALREGDPGPRVGVEQVVSSAELESRALAAGMSPGEWASYARRYEAALGKGDFDAAGVVLEQRAGHLSELEAASAELAFRSRRGGEPAAGGGPDVVGVARGRGSDAGLSEGSWEATETLIEQALAEGRAGEARALIRERNQMITELEARAAVPAEPEQRRGSGDVSELGDVEGRLDRLRDGKPSPEVTGVHVERAPQEVLRLLEGAPVPAESGRVVDAGEARALESLVVRARTAKMPAQEIAGWQDRFTEAWNRGPEGEGEIGRLARQWHRELDALTGGSSRPGVEELFASAPAKAETAQEVLARAAEDAGLSLGEHASWMKQVRDAWAQGRGEDAATLIDQFWGRIEEASASKSTGLELELLTRQAELRGLSLGEFLAAKERQEAAESVLREDLKAVLDIPAGEGRLRGRLREVLDGLTGDAAASPFAEVLKDILESRPQGSPEDVLRGDVTALLEQTVGPRLRPEVDTALLKELAALADAPVGDAVWAEGVKKTLASDGRRVGMPEGEVSYWENRLRDAVEGGGDKRAVVEVADAWLSRYKQFESVESLAQGAKEAGQDPVEAAGFEERLTDALRQEEIAEFNSAEADWRQRISEAKEENAFQQSVDEVVAGLKPKAERFGMGEEEWAGFEHRIRQARAKGDLGEVIQVVEERAQRLEELETVYDAGIQQRLDTLRGGRGGGSGEAEAYRLAVEPEWRNDQGERASEAELWNLFEDEKPDTLKDRFDDPDDDPLRDLDGNDNDGPGDWGADARRRLKDLQGDLFAHARRVNMTPEEIELWESRIGSADDPVAVKEELRRRVEEELVPRQELEARIAAFEKTRRWELIDLGFTPHELNVHQLGMEAAA
ncbi:hypothetical protein AB0C77_38005, partial [Streptomyces sp. NPDC048629]|uniref:hypothetical protein n=1 Tax=Streptomyces sp. NPDC048629 TaxID=3154824 RepID=UPI003446E21A